MRSKHDPEQQSGRHNDVSRGSGIQHQGTLVFFVTMADNYKRAAPRSITLNRLIGWLCLSFMLALTPHAASAQQDQGAGAQDPDEIKDTLERAKANGVLRACADPYDWPYSQQNGTPPGFDVEIFQQIAKLGGMRAEMFWSDTGTRGGLGRAFRNSIFAKRCDIFLGLSDSGEEDAIPDRLTFTKPYISLGYVLVVQGKADKMKTLQELKDNQVKIGVSMSTPIDDYLFSNKIPRELYLGNRRIMEGMAKGEVDASIVWATAIAVAKQEFPTAKFHMVEGYVPLPEHRFNSRFAVRKEDKSLLEFVNQSIEQLLNNGKVKQIVESYGVPFYPPLAS
jgi:ABC-type amino acid transport substrate-binding protein